MSLLLAKLRNKYDFFYIGKHFNKGGHQDITFFRSLEIGQYHKQEDDRIEGFEMAKAQKAAQQAATGSPQQIAQDMIAHLKEMGVNVHNKEELIKYLEENGYDDIVQAIEENREMQAIKEQAIADGTFMKAPNGKPTNLTEKQWLQVRTKNFIRWFGDWINDPANASKVVDENGEPLVVYHHTDNPNLTEFSTNFDNYFTKDGGTKEAIFFDEEPTGTLNRKYDIPVFLNIRELNEYNETKQQLHDRGTTYREVVNESAKKNNKTGSVHMKDFDDNKKEHQSIWIIHSSNQVKSATDNNGEFSRENDDIQMAIGPKNINNSLSLQEKSNIRTLLKRIDRTGTTLLDDGEGNMYLLDHTDREGIETRNPRREDGFSCRMKFSIDGYTNEEIEVIKNEIENGSIRDQKSFDKWVKSHIGKQRSDESNRIVTEVRSTNGNDDSLYLQLSEGESFGRGSDSSRQENFGTGFIRVSESNGINGPRYIPIGDASSIQTYTTSQGEVYGFVTSEGDMYLDEEVISPEHPMHEYTHLWDGVIKEVDPRLWNRGKKLMQTEAADLWKEIAESENYGKKWEKQGKSKEKIEDLIVSEVKFGETPKETEICFIGRCT